VLLVTLYLCYTCLLDHYAPRYCFGWLSILVMAATGSFFSLFDLVGEITSTRMDRMFRAACVAAGLLLMILGTNQYALKLFRAAPDPANPVYYDRLGVRFKSNYADADRYVADHLEPGDIVLTRAPHVYLFATGKLADYSFDPRLLERLLYDGGQNPPGYIDKWMGIREIRSLPELEDVQGRAHRVWIIADAVLDNQLQYTRDVANYLTTNAELAYVTTEERVFLLPGANSAGARLVQVNSQPGSSPLANN
jgi:hypothetical protein